MLKNICVNFSLTADQEERLNKMFLLAKSKGLDFSTPESLFESMMITGSIIDINNKLSVYENSLNAYVSAVSGS